MADAAYNSGSHPRATGKCNENSSRRGALGLIAMGAAAVPSLAMAGGAPAPMVNPYAAPWSVAVDHLARVESEYAAVREKVRSLEAQFFAARRDDMTSAEKRAIADRLGLPSAYRDEERMADASMKAHSAIFAQPAPDHAALLRKLEMAMEGIIECEEFGPLIADVRRLGGLA